MPVSNGSQYDPTTPGVMVMPRTVRIEVTTITEPAEGECEDCGFDALRRIRGYHITPSGVRTLFDSTFCGRCRAEEKRSRHDEA